MFQIFDGNQVEAMTIEMTIKSKQFGQFIILS